MTPAAALKVVRQSLISRHSLCPRSVLFDLQTNGSRSPGPSAACGTVLHRSFHDNINYMRANGEDEMPVDMAMEMLTRIMAQVDVPDHEVVPLSFKDMDYIRKCVVKWCENLSKHIIPSRVVAVEHRLYATVQCVGSGGEVYDQRISGQIDVLQAKGRGVAEVDDHKTGPKKPVQPRDEEFVDGNPNGAHLEPLGWAQAGIYGFLVFENYPAIRTVIFKEWSVIWGECRTRVMDRATEYERIRDVISAQVSSLNAALSRQQTADRWPAMAGNHCAMCSNKLACPIREAEGILTSEEEALEAYTAWHVNAEQRKDRAKQLKVWIEGNGNLDLPGGKQLGYDYSDGKKNFGVFKPPEPEPPAPEPEPEEKGWEDESVPF